MGSKELSSPHVQLPSSFENISDCKPLWCGLWIHAELKTRLAPNSQTFLNYPREKKKKDHLCSQEVSCCGSMWDPVLPLHLANWEWQWESNKYKPHSQSLTTTTKCLQPNLGLIYLWNVLYLGVTPELLMSKLPARFTKHRQHLYREVQLKATHLTRASLCIYWLQCGVRDQGKFQYQQHTTEQSKHKGTVWEHLSQNRGHVCH